MTPEITEFHAFAHDLRHFLREAITRSQLALRREKDSLSPAMQETLESVIRAGLNADDLVKATVMYYEASTRSDRTAPLKRLLQALPLDMRPALDSSGSQLHIAAPLDESEVPQPLLDVWKELVGNSVKFRRPDVAGRITLEVQLVPEQLRFYVQDNGIGIAPQSREEAFQPYKRLHSKSAYPGYGLGLARGRRILRTLGGDLISADCEEGARFEGWCLRSA